MDAYIPYAGRALPGGEIRCLMRHIQSVLLSLFALEKNIFEMNI